ncbi:hypothetical protein OUZ56_028013 [Daphnia magna]|uniref:Uncharacterized protein n=1 Tax=Daphnia magna TaxID=35525 RepID=A0ABR0B2L0_9CRUS|nr:hypothetical protein OUZ56_028013 [Daphnia magna]
MLPVNECRRRGSCRDAERPISTGSGIIATGDKKPHYGGSTGHPSKAYTYSPRGVELTSESGWTRRQWKEEVNAKHYPFEWMIGCLFPVPLLIEYRRLSSHVDTLLLARLVEVREPIEEDQDQPRPNAIV